MKPLWTLAEVRDIATTEAKYLVLPGSWKLEGWFTGARTLGKANHDRCKITLNKQALPYQPVHVVQDIVRHEVAHAYAGYLANHGPTWVEFARAFGVRAPAPSIFWAMDWPAPYFLYCRVCDTGHERWRKTRGIFTCTSCPRPLRWYSNPEYIKF